MELSHVIAALLATIPANVAGMSRAARIHECTRGSSRRGEGMPIHAFAFNSHSRYPS